jgi:hypothetical protein
MNKARLLILIAALLAATIAQGQSNSNLVYQTPVSSTNGKKSVTLFDVWPKVDELLRN